MDSVVVVGLVVGSSALGVVGARGALGAVLHVMAHPPARIGIRWHRVMFAAALFWFWYLAPGIGRAQ
jgi:hypothetical protein